MDALGIEIRKDAWAVAHVKSSFLGARFQRFFLLNGESAARRIEELKGYISNEGLKGVRTALVLPWESAVTGVLNVPAPGAEAVEGVIKFELERHVPFAPEETLHSFQIIKGEKNVFTVLFAAAGKDAVDSAVKSLAGSGLDPACVVPWQTSVYNALYSKGALRPRRNTVLVWIGDKEIRLEAFECAYPAFSRSVRIRGGREHWIEEVKKELRFYLTMAGTQGRRLDECIVMDESAGQSDGSGVAHFLSSELGIPAETLKLEYAAPSTAAPAIGAAFTAIGSSRVDIDLAGGSASRASSAWRRTIAFGLAAGALLVITGASYPVKDFLAERSLERAVAGAQEQREKVASIAGVLKPIEEQVKTLEEIEGSTTWALESLRELTETVPDDTYLTGFEYNREAQGYTINIEGVSRRASSVLLKIERSAHVLGPEFTGPVVKDPGGRERFRMKFSSAGS